MPGVVAIVTGADLVAAGVKPLVQSADFKRADGSTTAAPPQHVLAVDAVRHVGECVAAIVAETAHQARDAAEAIDVRYEPLPSVADVDAAVAPGAPLVWAEGDRQRRVRGAARRRGEGRRGVREGRAQGERSTSSTSACIAAPIEPRTTLAYLDERDRPAHAAHELPDADRLARRARRRRSASRPRTCASSSATSAAASA